MGNACGDEGDGDGSRCWRQAHDEVCGEWNGDLSVAMKSGQVEYATSVFGEGLITLSVDGGNGSMEVADE